MTLSCWILGWVIHLVWGLLCQLITSCSIGRTCCSMNFLTRWCKSWARADKALTVSGKLGVLIRSHCDDVGVLDATCQPMSASNLAAGPADAADAELAWPASSRKYYYYQVSEQKDTAQQCLLCSFKFSIITVCSYVAFAIIGLWFFFAIFIMLVVFCILYNLNCKQAVILWLLK